LLKRGDILRLINTMPGTAESPFEQAKLLTQILTRAGQQFVLPGFKECESNFDVFIEHYAKRMNFLLKGGCPDEYRAATDIIRRFQSGGFGQVTLEKCDQDFEDLFAPPVQIVSVKEEEDV
jgi:ribosome biogenesis GTPase A